MVHTVQLGLHKKFSVSYCQFNDSQPQSYISSSCFFWLIYSWVEWYLLSLFHTMQPGWLKKLSESVIANTMIVNLKATLPAIVSWVEWYLLALFHSVQHGLLKINFCVSYFQHNDSRPKSYTSRNCFSLCSTQCSTGWLKKISASVIANIRIVDLKATLPGIVSALFHTVQHGLIKKNFCVSYCQHKDSRPKSYTSRNCFRFVPHSAARVD